MPAFDNIKNGLELPKINVNHRQQHQQQNHQKSSDTPTNGKEVNLNLQTSPKNGKYIRPRRLMMMKNSDFSDSKRNGLNFELSLSPRGKENNSPNIINEESKYSKSKSKLFSQQQHLSNSAKIALNFNLAVNMDDDKRNSRNSSMLIDSNTLNSTPNKMIIDQPSSIKVAVRMRPLTENEIKSQKNEKISDILMNDNKVVLPKKGDSFEFDYCFNSSNRELFNYASQEIVYKKMGQPLLDYALQGYNACLFAYGQSGSGKTYTMLGTDDNPGITRRFLNDLFKRISTAKKDIEYIVNVSFLEIYNEKIYDLFTDELNMVSKNLRVREHPETGPYVEDLTVFTVDDYEMAIELLDSGLNRRKNASTNLNEESSRSHSIFSIIIVQNRLFSNDNHDYATDNENDENQIETSCISKINLVDLAGSERIGHADSNRFREGTMINKSLLTLGKVISQLADNGRQNNCKQHIPYRESTLTYLLRESLGGNSRTSMIATISPAKCHLEETMSTLRYASTAQRIINIVHVNDDPKMKIINSLIKQISFLRKEVDRTRDSSNIIAVDSNDECVDCSYVFERMMNLKEKLRPIFTKSSEYSENINKMQKQINNYEQNDSNNNRYDHQMDKLESVIRSIKNDEKYLKDLKTIDDYELEIQSEITLAMNEFTKIDIDKTGIDKSIETNKDNEDLDKKVKNEDKAVDNKPTNNVNDDTYHSCDQSKNDELKLALEDSTTAEQTVDDRTKNDECLFKDEISNESIKGSKETNINDENNDDDDDDLGKDVKHQTAKNHVKSPKNKKHDKGHDYGDDNDEKKDKTNPKHDKKDKSFDGNKFLKDLDHPNSSDDSDNSDDFGGKRGKKGKKNKKNNAGNSKKQKGGKKR